MKEPFVFLALFFNWVRRQSSTAGSATWIRHNGKSEVLELGTKILQKDSELDPINIYLIGLHPMTTDLGQLAKRQEGVYAFEKQFQRCTTTNSGCRREEYHERRRVKKC